MVDALFVVQSSSVQQVALKENLAIADLQSKLDVSSAAKRESDEKLAKLQADMDQELDAFRGREGELAQL